VDGEYFFFHYLRYLKHTWIWSRYVDPRTRTDRIENETNHWTIQMGCLVEAYLDYRHRDLRDGMPNCNGIPAASPSDDTERVSLSEIELIDIFSTYIDLVLLVSTDLNRSKMLFASITTLPHVPQ
jgi:hypothetical protein